MGFFSNVNIDQETDREQCAVRQTDEVPVTVEPTRLSTPADTAAQTPSASQEEVKKQAATETVQPTEDEKRKAHEEAEAKRKAEWEEKQRKRKEKEQIEWEKAVAVDDDTLIATSVKHLGDTTERLTRRNMKLCVTEYVQTLCYEDLAFARLVMHPRKSMVNCFHYINRKAREYLEKEMKDNDEKPENGAFGGDVPDDICYQWAEEYFRDLNAKEDRTDEDKEFVPKPYRSSSPATSKKKADQKKTQPAKQDKAKETEKPTHTQMTLESFMVTEKKAS